MMKHLERSPQRRRRQCRHRAVFDAGQPVNFGKVWFAGQTPPGTVLQVQFRTSADGEAWSD